VPLAAEQAAAHCAAAEFGCGARGAVAPQHDDHVEAAIALEQLRRQSVDADHRVLRHVGGGDRFNQFLTIAGAHAAGGLIEQMSALALSRSGRCRCCGCASGAGEAKTSGSMMDGTGLHPPLFPTSA